MLERLTEIDWSRLTQPEWNAADAVPASLRALAMCASEEEALAAYHAVLYALGNNHAGTYYPVTPTAVSFLGEVLVNGGQWARISTLDILLDLYGSFEPEPGVRTTETGEATHSLGRLVRESISGLSSLVKAAATSDRSVERERTLAVALLELMSGDR
jgi:hypothetical protein